MKTLSLYKTLPILIVAVSIWLFAGIVFSPKAHADTCWPGSGGYCAQYPPDFVESQLRNACASTGNHTYWALWMNPYVIDPPASATTYTVYLMGVAYVCPGVTYSGISNARIFGLSEGYSAVSLSGSSLPTLGSASKGEFTPVRVLAVTMNLASVPKNDCTNYRIGFSVEALHGGSYDSDSGLSTNVTVCYYPDPPPSTTAYNMSARIGKSGSLTVQPGTTVTINTSIHNVGNATSDDLCGGSGTAGGCMFVRSDSDTGTYVDFPAAASGTCPALADSPTAPGSPNSGGQIFSPYGAGKAFCNHSAGPGAPGPYRHWRFSYNPIPAGGSGYGSFELRIWPDAPNGNFCLFAYVYKKTPSSTAVASTDDPLCLTIEQPRYPYLTTYGGDVHAGTVRDCTNLAAGDNKQITGRVYWRDSDGDGNQDSSDEYWGSRSQYGLSATGIIKMLSGNIWGSFGSNNNPRGINLTLGNDPGNFGNYYRVICQSDYTQLAANVTLPAGTYTARDLAAYDDTTAGRGVIVRITGNATITGGSPDGYIDGGRRLTVIADGHMHIADPITYNTIAGDPSSLSNPTFTSRNNIPAFAAIAGGNMSINPDVTTLYGTYIANGTMSTCATGATSTAALTTPSLTTANNTCNSSLFVYGNLTADNFYLRRIRGDARLATSDTASNGAAEYITLTPLLFLAPPPGFDNIQSGGSGASPRYQADLPPLF